MTETQTPAHPHKHPLDIYAVCFAMVFPTIVTLVYFQWLKTFDASIQQTAFGIGKVIQFGFPIAWVIWFHREKFKSTPWIAKRLGVQPTDGVAILDATHPNSKNDIPIGIVFGLVVAASLFLMYFVILADTEIANRLTVLVKEKVSSMGIGSFAKYLGVGIFYALCHSFMEEYYWRWFTFDMLRKFVPNWGANLLSSLGFMAHHVVLLGFFLDWHWLTYPFSFCIAIGGMFWAWQYRRTGRLLAPWISHMVVDAGIFSLGYFLIKEIL